MDIVIAGAGMAGLAAALAAAEAGARVLVLEKSDRVGGNAALSAGMFLGATAVQELHSYIPDGSIELQQLLCRTYPEAIAWLEGHGMPLAPAVEFGDFRVVRPMGVGEPGRRGAFLARLAEQARAAGATIRTSEPLVEVVRTDGRYVVTSRGGTVHARSLVLATGGFQGSQALLSEHLGEQAARALMLRSRPESAGDGLRLALRLGGTMSANLDRFYGHMMPDCAVPEESWKPITPPFTRLGVLVNRDGRRFTDEAAGLLEETNPQDACRQPGGIAYLIFDDAMCRGLSVDSGTASKLPAGDWLPLARRFGAPLWQAESLQEIVAVLARDGVAADALADELNAYVAACRHGRAGVLDPPRSANAIAFSDPPYYALRCRPAITATSGGIAIDAGCRVEARDGGAVPGLYAAGVDAGGVYGRTYGGFLSWSLVSGLIAGRNATAEAATL